MKDLRRLLALAGMCAILSEAAPQTADAFPPDSVTSRMDYENMLQQPGICLPGVAFQVTSGGLERRTLERIAVVVRVLQGRARSGRKIILYLACHTLKFFMALRLRQHQFAGFHHTALRVIQRIAPTVRIANAFLPVLAQHQPVVTVINNVDGRTAGKSPNQNIHLGKHGLVSLAKGG